MFIIALLITAQWGKQPKGPTADERISKIRSLQTVDGSSALKTKGMKLLIQATARMNLEHITLCDISPTQKDKSVWLHLQEKSRKGKIIKTKSAPEVTRGRGEEEWEAVVQWGTELLWGRRGNKNFGRR